MPYGYIAETSHGDREFQTDVHHTQHSGGIRAWFTEHGPVIREAISDLVQLYGSTVQLLGIHESIKGRRGKKIAPTE